MRFRFTTPTLLALFAIAISGCSDGFGPAPAPQFAKPSCPGHPSCGGGGVEPVDADAALRDAMGDGLLSDGGAIYTTARIGEFFTLDARAATTALRLCFDFGGQLLPGDVGFPGEPGPLLCDDGQVTTGVDNFLPDNQTPGVALLDMTVGDVQRARFGGFYVREGFNWSFSYGRNCDTGANIPGDRATITRVSASEWTIAASSMSLCKTRTKGPKKNDGLVSSGLDMPFLITATLQ